MEDTNRTSTGPGTFVITTCFPQLRANGKVPAVPLTTSGSLQLKSPVLFGQFRSGRALSRSDARHQLFSLTFFISISGHFSSIFFRCAWEILWRTIVKTKHVREPYG